MLNAHECFREQIEPAIEHVKPTVDLVEPVVVLFEFVVHARESDFHIGALLIQVGLQLRIHGPTLTRGRAALP